MLTNSELEAFDACRALHGYTYHEGLRPKVTARPLTLGTMGHMGVKAGWNAACATSAITAPWDERATLAIRASEMAINEANDDAAVEIDSAGGDMVQERLDDLNDDRLAALFAVRHYFQQNIDIFDITRFVPIAIERPFSVILPTATGRPSVIEYNGVMDLVVYDRERNHLVVEDYKFTTKNPVSYERKIALSTQLTGYLVALRQMQRSIRLLEFGGIRDSYLDAVGADFVELHSATTGSIAYNVIRAVVPKQPLINKNGLVSCQQIDTLPSIYQNALFLQETERGKPTTPEQMELLARIKAKACWFQKIEFFRDENEIQRWRREVEVKAREIRASERHPELRVRNPGHCSSPSSYGCSMAIVCMDPDSEETRKNSYRVARSRHEEVEQAIGNQKEDNEFGF